MTDTEYRRSPRVRPGRIVCVTFLDRSLVDGGTLIDISDTGVGILVDAPIETGTTLHVEIEHHLLVGTAVYCRPAENGHFRVGLQLVNRLGGPAWEELLRKWQPSSPPAPSGDSPLHPIL